MSTHQGSDIEMKEHWHLRALQNQLKLLQIKKLCSNKYKCNLIWSNQGSQVLTEQRTEEQIAPLQSLFCSIAIWIK